MPGNLQVVRRKLRGWRGVGKSPGAQRQSGEACGEKAKVACDRREKPTDTSTASCRAQPGFLLLCKNEASIQPAPSTPVLDGLHEGLIKLGFQERGGGLNRKEIIGPGSR